MRARGQLARMMFLVCQDDTVQVGQVTQTAARLADGWQLDGRIYQVCHDNTVQVRRVKVIAHCWQAAHVVRLRSKIADVMLTCHRAAPQHASQGKRCA